MKQAIICLIIFTLLVSFSGCKKNSDTLTDSKLTDSFSYSQADKTNAKDDSNATNNCESDLESNSNDSSLNNANSIDDSSKNNINATDSIGKAALPNLPATVNINSHWPQITITKLSFNYGVVDFEATVDNNDRDYDAAFYIQLVDENGFFVEQVICYGGHLPSGGKFKGRESFLNYEYSENYTLRLADYP